MYLHNLRRQDIQLCPCISNAVHLFQTRHHPGLLQFSPANVTLIHVNNGVPPKIAMFFASFEKFCATTLGGKKRIYHVLQLEKNMINYYEQ